MRLAGHTVNKFSILTTPKTTFLQVSFKFRKEVLKKCQRPVLHAIPTIPKPQLAMLEMSV
ncbi:CLUMA_CG010427, isoform A [Clunio marinus]|uniref:CLUMA_CG010427, isoform A n=1 Tax=Clunio marinus TaxID=568069 RepID=A0A1J1IB55_9DIPT|nr:CLUMA_CG010427, isoform A [Clunio marinus]